MNYKKIASNIKGMHVLWKDNKIFPNYTFNSGSYVSQKRINKAIKVVVKILEEEENKAQPDQCADRETAVTAALLSGLLGDLCCLFRRQFQLGDDLVGRPFDAARVISIAKKRLHAFDIFECQAIGDDRFQAVTHLYPHALFIGGHQQNDTIVALGIAKRPCTAKLVSIIGNVIALQAVDCGDHELTLVPLLELVELLGQTRLGRLVDDVGLIDNR